MTVEIVTGSTPELVEAMGRLIPQLSRSAPALTAAECEALVAQNGVYLFIFRSDESPDGGVRPILGMLTLATFTIPTGLRAWVEDVVVDSAARGQGAGRALVEAAVAHDADALDGQEDGEGLAGEVVPALAAVGFDRVLAASPARGGPGG